jgi:NRPS condensation-like uncharacterized protein
MPEYIGDVVRPLGVIEEFLWLFDFSSPKQFCVIAEIEGETSIPAWRAALDEVQMRHPMLSVCINSTRQRVPQFSQVQDCQIPLRIISPGIAWEREAEHEIRTLFDPTQAPLVRVSLIHEPRRSFVLITAHHSVADGMSSVFLIRDMLLALTGQPLERYSLPASIDQLLSVPPRQTSAPGVSFSHTLAKECLQKDIHVNSRAMPVELTERLQTRVRAEGTTIHGIVCAAAAAAGRKADTSWRENPVSVFSPVDIRKLLHLQDECVVAFSKAATTIEPNPSQNLWDVARFIRESLLPFKTLEGLEPGFKAIYEAMSTDMNEAQGALFNAAGFSETMMVSNVGKVPYDADFGKLRLRSLWAPVMLRGHEPEQTIGVSTINGALHLVHTSWKPVPGFLNGIERELNNASRHPKESDLTTMG